MFLTVQKIKVSIAEVDKNPSYVANKAGLNASLKGGIAAIGQIGNDAENKQYTLFVTAGNKVDAYITIEITDDEDYMIDLFEKTVKKFNKLNKHLKYLSVRTEVANIIITYEGYPSNQTDNKKRGVRTFD